jgi:hypothetical protein
VHRTADEGRQVWNARSESLYDLIGVILQVHTEPQNESRDQRPGLMGVWQGV